MHLVSLCSLHLARDPFPPGQPAFSPPLQGPTLLLRLRSRSWCVALGWPLPSVGQWLHVGIPGQEGPGEVQVTTPFRHLMPVPITSQGPVGTHPPHGRPGILCQTPQATPSLWKPRSSRQRPGPLQGPARPGWVPAASAAARDECAPQGAGHTGAAAAGLGVVGGQGQGRGVRASGCGREAGGPVPGDGSGLHCRGTAPASHMQCNSNAHAGRPLSGPPYPHPACAAASREGPATCSTPSSWGQH